MSNYYMQIYYSSEELVLDQDWVGIDELPYQKLIIERLAELGAIKIKDKMIPVDQIERVAKILRLRQSLGVSLSGAVIICELLDRIDEMEKEIERYKHF